ncbi:MAG: cytidine deaminase [Planctomycetota bacterium]
MTETAQLIEAARAAAQQSYCPYSKFAVGAAILWSDGELSVGVNVENASYPLSVCAERSAVSEGVRRGQRRIHKVAVWADVDDVVAPCGACRQVLYEFCSGDAASVEVILAGRTAKRTTTLDVLLPDAFGPQSLH